jgi:oligopeptide/dipeptide ABC transporter ATP-binding protein
MGSLPGTAEVRRGEKLHAIPGNVPHPLRVPAGCPFRDRCHLAIDACAVGLPPLGEKEPGHWARCIRVEPRV